MNITFWYSEGAGVKIFNNTTRAYFKEHGVYPVVDTQLPAFLNSLGYACRAAIGMGRRGITMTQEDAIVFKLKWAYD